MSSEDYAREKLGMAIRVLATGTKSLQDRLADAYLCFHPLQPRDFSREDDAELYRTIMSALTVVKDGPEENGYVRNTLAQMSDEQAREVARNIVALNDRLDG